ncbi:MAG: hypothetical protein ALECFALPRED_010271 [Alectoria fallacina]|uniref:Uncharacterized protein n=1 Tax=Alectoria fallacina TaxID=1903189 RepID=A0A8H3J8R6_9LECA|nr:MAG: hypothetical protein ALECFALPRED_010271 [Alectoria fallacina]
MESIANDMADFGKVTIIDPEKLKDLKTVLTTILALPIARDTFAQVIDGTPTRTPFSDEIKSSRFTFSKTVIVNDNMKPSHKAVQKTDEIKTAFAPQDLMTELKLAQRYQDASQGSREYLLHLLEIAAASVHALAGSLYASSRKNVEIKPPWLPGGHSRLFDRTDEFFVNFYHTNYRLFEKYPFGLLDVVGYWAEAEIFGGVVLFEHEGSSGITKAFLHPPAKDFSGLPALGETASRFRGPE